MSSKSLKSLRQSFHFFLLGLFLLILSAAFSIHASRNRAWMEHLRAEADDRSRVTVQDQAPRAVEKDACPAQTPILTGFDDGGNPKCRSLKTATCGAGQYISSIDPSTLTLHCSPAGGSVTCPSGTFITEFMWLGEDHVSFSCSPRLDPFKSYKFEPSFVVTGAH